MKLITKGGSRCIAPRKFEKFIRSGVCRKMQMFVSSHQSIDLTKYNCSGNSFKPDPYCPIL